MKKRWGFVCLCLLMTGCARLSDVDESFLKETKEPEVEQDDTPAVMQCDSETQGTLTFEAKGDQIQNMTQTFSMSFADLGISEDLDQNAIKEKINQSLESMYQDLEGVQAVGEIVEGHVEITVTIDYTAFWNPAKSTARTFLWKRRKRATKILAIRVQLNKWTERQDRSF